MTEAPASLKELAGGQPTLGELLLSRRGGAHDVTRVVTDYRRGFLSRPEASYEMTREDQWQAAARAAGVLAENGVARGDHVVILLPTGADFVAAFFGCQILGAVPVPLVPPWSLSRIENHISRISAVCRIA